MEPNAQDDLPTSVISSVLQRWLSIIDVETSSGVTRALHTSAPTLISEKKEVLSDSDAGKVSADRAAKLRESFEVTSSARIEQIDLSYFYVQSFTVDPSLLRDLDFFVHWGIKGEQWSNQEVREEEIESLNNGEYLLRVKLLISKPGNYASTLCLKHMQSSEYLWQGQPGSDDAEFTVREISIREFPAIGTNGKKRPGVEMLLQSVDSYEEFSRTIMARSKDPIEVAALGRSLFQLTSVNPEMREKLSEHFSKAKQVLASSRQSKERRAASDVLNLLQRIGIGEVVLIAPEGPQASAGGLSHVISGLLKSLSENSIHATLIAPLYDQENGKRHPSAAKLLQDGITVDGKVLPLTFAGEIILRYGRTHDKHSGASKRFEELLPVKIYSAEAKNFRILLLKHRRLADKLYRNVWADEQIRRALFLSQGALEILSKPEFRVTPHLIISNDWMTGLVPALIQTNPRYKNNPALRDAGTVHVIHNGGRDYQGCFPASHYGEDLFPLFGVGGEHYFGFADPHDRSYLNLTAAAVFHVRQAILTVSKPYASQLLTSGGGEGLESLYRRRRRILYGISNGIDRYAIRRAAWELGFKAKDDEKRAARFRDALYVNRLPAIKAALKKEIVEKFGLEKRDDSRLICLVGRLAEQKGIRLLTEEISAGETVLSTILKNFPEAQFFICGPKSENDPAFELLQRHVKALGLAYPGRIASIFDFVPHQEALQITAGSDLFLMPSRYEPGGITQLEALAVGTPVVARNVGGLQATLRDVRKDSKNGNAFLFEQFFARELLGTLEQALGLLSNDENRSNVLRLAAEAENDWSDRLPSYLALFRFIAGVSDPFHRFSYLGNEMDLVESIRAS